MRRPGLEDAATGYPDRSMMIADDRPSYLSAFDGYGVLRDASDSPNDRRASRWARQARVSA
jgi:hypothetical protein